MRHIHTILEDKEAEELAKIKGKRTWKEFLLECGKHRLKKLGKERGKNE
jgi:hypothetical protein